MRCIYYVVDDKITSMKIDVETQRMSYKNYHIKYYIIKRSTELNSINKLLILNNLTIVHVCNILYNSHIFIYL